MCSERKRGKVAIVATKEKLASINKMLAHIQGYLIFPILNRLNKLWRRNFSSIVSQLNEFQSYICMLFPQFLLLPNNFFFKLECLFQCMVHDPKCSVSFKKFTHFTYIPFYDYLKKKNNLFLTLQPCFKLVKHWNKK